MKPCPAPSTAVPVAMAAISARSWPEVNALPRPVSTTAPIASSASASRRAAVASWYSAVSKALRTSGRLKAMTRTPGAASSVSTRLTGSVLLGRGQAARRPRRGGAGSSPPPR